MNCLPSSSPFINLFVLRMNAASHQPKYLFFFLAIGLAFIGLAFLLAAGQSNALVRLSIGAFCLAGAGGLIYLGRMRPVEHTHVHKMELDLPGEVTMKSFECKSCGATLDSKSVTLVAGAIHVNCPYCGSSYQMEEAPKW